MADPLQSFIAVEARRLGREVVLTGRNPLSLRHPLGPVVVTSGTPKSEDAWRFALAKLKKKIVAAEVAATITAKDVEEGS